MHNEAQVVYHFGYNSPREAPFRPEPVVASFPNYYQSYTVSEELAAQVNAALECEQREGGGWVPDALPLVGQEHQKSVGLTQSDCPICGWEFDPIGVTDKKTERYTQFYTGSNSGVRISSSEECPCNQWRAFYPCWVRSCPQTYRWVRLSKLEPSEESRLPTEFQLEKIEFLQKNPGLSYLFSGPASTGKTVFSMALLRFAINSWVSLGAKGKPPVWRINASLLLKQAHMEVMDRPDGEGKEIRPLVDGAMIRECAQLGQIPHPFLEEIDKMPKLTDFRADFLFSVFDAIYECDGQIVMSSNKTSAQLRELFGPINGEAFMRRIRQQDGRGQIWNFYKVDGLRKLKSD
jgi:hypothetical protein